MNLNEHFTNEKDIRFEALQMLRATQAKLTEINFLEVIALMKPLNPLKKDILKFEEELNDLTISIGNFIQAAKNDVEYQPDEKEEEPEEKEEESEPVKETVSDSSVSEV